MKSFKKFIVLLAISLISLSFSMNAWALIDWDDNVTAPEPGQTNWQFEIKVPPGESNNTPNEAPIGVRVMVNGKFLIFDVPPYINPNTDRTMIPIRTVAEALDCKVDWDNINKIASIQRNDTLMTMKIGSKIANVKGQSTQLDAPVELTNGRTLVPLRFIAENFGAKVDWDGITRTVIITYEK